MYVLPLLFEELAALILGWAVKYPASLTAFGVRAFVCVESIVFVKIVIREEEVRSEVWVVVQIQEEWVEQEQWELPDTEKVEK